MITFTLLVFAAVSVSVSVDPAQITVIDVPPSNNFTLTCTAISASDSAATKVFTWSKKQALSSTSPRELIHNGGSIFIITSSDVSTLMTSETQSGGYTYTCSGRVGDGDASTDTATVNVRGINLTVLITLAMWYVIVFVVLPEISDQMTLTAYSIALCLSSIMQLLGQKFVL